MSDGIDWGLVALAATCDADEFVREVAKRNAIAAALEAHRAQAQSEQAQHAPQHAPQSEPSSSAPVPAPAQKPTPPVGDAEALLAKLESLQDDAERERVLAGVPAELRVRLNALIVYHAMAADDSADAPYAEFTRRLAAAADDAERAAIIAATSKGFVEEWTWRQDATVDDWRLRYLALCGGEQASD